MNLKGGKAETFGSIGSFFYQRWAEPSLEPMHRRLAAEIPVERGKLLDIGCGPGNLDRKISVLHPDLTVVGLDESEAMLGRAMRRPRPSSAGRVVRASRTATRIGNRPGVAQARAGPCR